MLNTVIKLWRVNTFNMIKDVSVMNLIKTRIDMMAQRDQQQ